MKNLIVLMFVLIGVVCSIQPAAAQSPNTATMIVIVLDQTGTVVNDAKVSVVNTATGDSREDTTARGNGLRRRGNGGAYVWAVCWWGGFGDECNPGVCEHRPAADVSVTSSVYVLKTNPTDLGRWFVHTHPTIFYGLRRNPTDVSRWFVHT